MTDAERDQRIAEIQQRVDKATQGTWTAESRNSMNHGLDDDDGFLGWEIDGPPVPTRGQFLSGRDADFIANAPAYLRWLLEQLAAKDKRIEELEARLARYDQTIEDIVTGGTDG